jgi:ribosomal protein S18 acetylase RimI-like enzyme
MNFQFLEHKQKYELFQVANIHKDVLHKTIATTLSSKNLSKLYALLILSKNLEIVIATNSTNEILGSILINKNKFNFFNLNIIKIFFILISGFLIHPTIWIKEIYFKVGLYKKLTYNIKIQAVIINSKYQGQGIGKELLNYVINNNLGKIVLDTRADNYIAQKFYLENNFYIHKKNKKNISFKKIIN